jgi:hypothetical protein
MTGRASSLGVVNYDKTLSQVGVAVLGLRKLPESGIGPIPSNGRDCGDDASSQGGRHEDIDRFFTPPKKMRNTTDWFTRAKLVVAEARDRAAETAHQRQGPLMRRTPTVLQRRRLARLGLKPS